MSTLLRFLPYAVGIALGWLITNPPPAFQALGPWKYPILGGLVVLGLAAVGIASMLAATPENVQLTPLDSSVTRALDPLAVRFEAVGFTRIGSFTVEVKPPAKVVALVHEAERTYAAVFQTSTVPAKTFFDLVSILEGDRGGLTSGAFREGGSTPSTPGSLRQIFPDAPVETVFARHREGLAYLAQRGLRTRGLSSATFEGDFRTSLKRQRASFLRNPVGFILVTIWRAVTHSSPHVGPIQRQPSAAREIQRLLTGRMS